MKRITLLIVLIAIGSIAFYLISCKKDPVYSCDKEINKYAIETMSVNQNISRDSLEKLGIDTQFAVFNSLSSTNKLRIFKEKVALVLSIDSVPQADKDHLQLLHDNATEDMYDSGLGEQDTYIVNWKSQAVSNLGWDEVKMFLYVGTWIAMDRFTADNPIFEGGGGSSCKCSSRFACGFGLYSCTTGSCTETTTGCGIIGTMPCKGVCSY